MMSWIRGIFGRQRGRKQAQEKDGVMVTRSRKGGHVVPRSSEVTFDRAVDLVVRKHGDTLRELADR